MVEMGKRRVVSVLAASFAAALLVGHVMNVSPCIGRKRSRVFSFAAQYGGLQSCAVLSGQGGLHYEKLSS